MFGTATTNSSPNVRAFQSHESDHAKEIQGVTLGNRCSSHRQDGQSESDFSREDKEMEEDDDQGQGFLCACTWRCSI